MSCIFKECKKRFEKEPDYDHVVQLVATKLDIVPNEKLFSDVKDAFKYYKKEVEKNRSLVSSDRKFEETPCLLRRNYVGSRAKRPFEEVGEKQQRRRLSDFVATTSACAKQNCMHMDLQLSTSTIRKLQISVNRFLVIDS